MQRAVLYIRSSKDRAAVSLDAQRRELTELAREKHLAIVGEYADAVESGKDEHRPGFQSLLRALKDRNRGWTVILAFDTSRIARRRHVAQLLAREMERVGVHLLFAKVPEVDPISSVILESVLQAMDEVHSLMSREKGLAGMAENVRRGFRAGGRAPLGYRLSTVDTGTVRDGAAVTKCRLEPAEDAGKVGEFLRERAAGLPRATAAARAQLDVAVTTLIGVEWNALTYAGHTVWNVHAERVKGGYKGGAKRRPRSDWLITRDTHTALITEREAARILEQLESKRTTRAKPAKRIYLLAGLLSWEGTPWHGDSGNYRFGKGRKIEAERLERAVLGRLSEDLQSDHWVAALVTKIREQYAAEQDPGEEKRLEREVAEFTRRIERVGQLLSETTAPQALLRQIEGWEAARAKAEAQRAALAAAAEIARAAKAVREADVRRHLRVMAEDLSAASDETLKATVGRFIGAIDLDPVSYACTIRYKVETGDKLASPRGFELIPHFPEVASRFVVEPNRAWRRAA